MTKRRILLTMLVFAAVNGFSADTTNVETYLVGYWYSTFSEQTGERKAITRMIDHFEPNHVYHSELIESSGKERYHEKNDGAWRLTKGKLIITISRTNGKAVEPYDIPSVINIKNDNAFYIKVTDGSKSPSILLKRVDAGFKLPVAASKGGGK